MLIVVRHGRTVSNASGLLLGRADPDLDEVGRAQAATLASHLGPIDRVISSPLRRARQTAYAIASGGSAAAALGRRVLDVEIEDRFIELDYGEWDQRPLADVSGAEWSAWRADLNFAPPGGESLVALGGRVRSALDELAVASAESDIVVVTHVSPLKAAVAWALGVDDRISWRKYVPTAGIVRIATSGGRPSLHAYGETASAS